MLWIARRPAGVPLVGVVLLVGLALQLRLLKTQGFSPLRLPRNRRSRISGGGRNHVVIHSNHRVDSSSCNSQPLFQSTSDDPSPSVRLHDGTASSRVMVKAPKPSRDDGLVVLSDNNNSASLAFRTSRRGALISAAGSVSSSLLLNWSTLPPIAAASREDSLFAASTTPTPMTSETLPMPFLDCLQDLPPFDPVTTVRLYLCRHAETENNRLKIVQGARIDAPINETGQKQAVLLGQALARANVPPDMILYSPLQRAQQTARLAASQLVIPTTTTTSIALAPSKNYNSISSAATKTRQLVSLAEIDFGDETEGAPVSEKRAALVALYTAWALGNLDARMGGGGGEGEGESGRQVSCCVCVCA